MSDYSYGQIKEKISARAKTDILRCLKKQDRMEFSRNSDEALIIDFTFKSCLAQLTVSKPGFAPYQFISFEAMTLDSKKAQESGGPELIYFFMMHRIHWRKKSYPNWRRASNIVPGMCRIY